MRMAARAAVRAIGRVEPNPLVGCVIASLAGEVLGIGHHRRFGGPHAEVEALANARARGRDVRGSVMVVTLEPCDHTGKTGPCSRAVMDAGIGRVVYARRDPNPVSTGGAERLRAGGVEVAELGGVWEAMELSAPFCKRIETGLPWVIAKWAQTIDGAVATRTGSSQWISGERSRRMVHRTRAVVDAVCVGVGTVSADDPMLTARGVTVRRMARRVVIDSRARMPLGSVLVRTAREAPVTVVCNGEAVGEAGERIAALERAGVEVIAVDGNAEGRVDLRSAMRMLVDRYDATRVLVEGGAGLVSGLMGAGLVDEAQVYVAPMVLGDRAALGCVDFGGARELAEAARFAVRSVRRVGADVRIRMVRAGG